jgi:hypothetical protein
MAAVLCLVFIPLIASVGFMLGVVGGDWSAGSVLGGLAFFSLAAFMLYNAMNMSRVLGLGRVTYGVDGARRWNSTKKRTSPSASM